jgi:putative chitinase
MAKVRRKKTEVKKRIFSRFKFTESYTSLLLGAIVVLIVGILFISFARGNRNSQTSSTNDNQKTELQKSQDTSSTYTIKPGDDLWSISEDVYNDGYKWIEIAKINKIKNPELIHVGNKLMIPTVAPTIVQKELTAMKPKVSPNATDDVVENNSIIGNTYTIKPGDNLWDICVRAYGDGFKWPELAKVNNIQNPDLIYKDNVIKIPR